MPDWKSIREKVRECKNQIFTAAIANLGSFGTGNVFGWSSVAVPSLTKQFHDVTEEKISWVTSIAILAAFIGGPIAGVTMDLVGRRPAILIFTIPFLLGWITMFSAFYFRPDGFFLLYIGRFVTGFSAGAFLVIIPTYLKEISFDYVRGALGSTMPLLLCIGQLFSFTIGGLSKDWFALTVSCTIIPICLAIGTLLIPETPRYLAAKNKLDKAVASYKWLCRIESDEVARENMLAVFSAEVINSPELKEAPRKRKFLSRPVQCPIIIMTLTMIFQQFAGINAVALYTVIIFIDAGATALEPEHATIILGLVFVLANLTSVFVVELVGRKTLIISLNLLMTICLWALGAYFYLKERGDNIDKLVWLPFVTIYTFMAAYCCGVGSVVWVLGPEIYNPDYSAESATIMTSTYWISGFVVAKTFSDLRSSELKVSGSFWFYSAFCLAGAIFTAVFIPETRGKSNEEILRHFGALPPLRPVPDNDSTTTNTIELPQNEVTGTDDKLAVSILESDISAISTETEVDASSIMDKRKMLIA